MLPDSKAPVMPMHKKISPLTAFTLVEILIALAILAMIVASTFTIFRSSSQSWQKGETRSERYHNSRIALGRMSAEISQAVINKDALSRFIGKEDKIDFISFVSGAGGVFELAEIGYYLDRGKKLLMRNEDTEPDYDFSTYDTGDILADGISELIFSYYDGLTWSGAWDSGFAGEAPKQDGQAQNNRVLPEAVKIRVKIEDKHGRESETFDVITRLKMSW